MKAAPKVPAQAAPHPFRDVAAVTVDQIISDLRHRVGLGEEWDGITDEIKAQIRERWIDLALAAMDGFVLSLATTRRSALSALSHSRHFYLRRMVHDGIPGICRRCYCTERRACNPPCSWTDATHTLCTACVASPVAILIANAIIP